LAQYSSYETRLRARRDGERFRFVKKQDAPLRVCLAYANRYAVAMGNLGFQTVYEIFDRTDGAVCERAFLPDEEDEHSVGRGALRTLESGWCVADCDLIALSISFETDYLNVPRFFELAGLAARRSERSAADPLVIAGGPAIFLNPEPIADFIDLFLIGEAEEMLPEFLTALRRTPPRGSDRAALLNTMAGVRGAYVPDHFEPSSTAQTRALHSRGGGEARVERRLIWDLNRFSTSTRVLSDDAVFGDMVMVEASRGCRWGCRFCAAGFMYRPIRTRDPSNWRSRSTAGCASARRSGWSAPRWPAFPASTC
jgi:hypothetical protein